MVGVKVVVAATDDVDAAPTCGITSITAGEPAAADAAITSEFTADVRAVRDSDGSTRVYTIHVSCSDASGNTAEGTADVTISRDHPVKLLSRELAKRDRFLLAAHTWRWLKEEHKHGR
jgi:hypothetical protein